MNADVTIAAEAPDRDAEYQRWAAHLMSCGIAKERAWRHFEEWADEDTYFPLAEELAALADAGFSAEAPWRVVPSTVMVGVKAADPPR